MTTRFACPGCATPLECSDKLVGVKVVCPRCGRTMRADARTGPSIFVRAVGAFQNGVVGRVPDRAFSWLLLLGFAAFAICFVASIGVASYENSQRGTTRPRSWRPPPPRSVPLIPPGAIFAAEIARFSAGAER